MRVARMSSEVHILVERRRYRAPRFLVLALLFASSFVFGQGCSGETKNPSGNDASGDSNTLLFKDAIESGATGERGTPGSSCGDPCSDSNLLCQEIIRAAAAREEHVDYGLSRELYVIHELGHGADGKLGILQQSVLDDENPCLLIRDPERINTQVFNVLDYGAVGDGTSHSIGSSVIDTFWPPEERSCAANLRDAVAFLETRLTRAFPAQELESRYRAGLFQTRPGRPTGFASNDERDWIGIQSALLAAGRAGGGTVIIPDTGAEYLCNRQLWVPSNVRMLWLKDETRQAHSFLRMTERSEIVGAFIASYNEFDLPRSTINHLNFVCRLRFSNPRLRTLPGENAMGFSFGAFDVQIIGGELEGAYWGGPDEFAQGFNEMGGKAIQFEAGFMRGLIRETIIRDSSIGINATTTFPIGSCASLPSPACDDDELQIQYGPVCGCTARSPKTYFRAASHVHARDVITERVPAPISVFYPVLWSRLVTVNDRTQLETVSPQREMRFSGLTVREPLPWTAFVSRPYPGAGEGDYAGIFNFTFATHVTIEGENRIEAGGYAPTVFRGSGRDIDIGGVIVDGVIGRLLDGRFPYGRNSSFPQLEDVSIRGVTATGVAHAIVHLPGKPSPSHRVFLNTTLANNGLNSTSSVSSFEGPVLGEGESGYEEFELLPPYLSLERSQP